VRGIRLRALHLALWFHTASLARAHAPLAIVRLPQVHLRCKTTPLAGNCAAGDATLNRHLARSFIRSPNQLRYPLINAESARIVSQVLLAHLLTLI
jgi:hypothetical protein